MTAWSSSNRRSRLPTNWSSTIVPRILERDPTCRLRFDCCTTVSTEVDHRIAGDDHRPTNLQGVCHPCHERKTIAERPKQAPRKRAAERHPGLLRGGG